MNLTTETLSRILSEEPKIVQPDKTYYALIRECLAARKLTDSMEGLAVLPANKFVKPFDEYWHTRRMNEGDCIMDTCLNCGGAVVVKESGLIQKPSAHDKSFLRVTVELEKMTRERDAYKAEAMAAREILLMDDCTLQEMSREHLTYLHIAYGELTKQTDKILEGL